MKLLTANKLVRLQLLIAITIAVTIVTAFVSTVSTVATVDVGGSNRLVLLLVVVNEAMVEGVVVAKTVSVVGKLNCHYLVSVDVINAGSW